MQNQIIPFRIDPATRSDVPVLLEMIRELAEFERLAHEVEATEESLSAALFAPQPVAGALIANADGRAAGYAVYYFTLSTFVGRPGIFLEDLYVSPQFRKRGLGRALFEEVARIGLQRNAGRLEWNALSWNENALRFYKSLGAKMLNDWTVLRMNNAEIQNLFRPK